jgi:hypothetical protein
VKSIRRSGPALQSIRRGTPQHPLQLLGRQPAFKPSPRVQFSSLDESLTKALVQTSATLFIGPGGVPVWMVHADEGSGFGGQPWAVDAFLANSSAT